MEWKIKRDDREFMAPDTATLQLWAKEGHVVATDYVLNPTLDRWMYAREVAELANHFAVNRQASRGSCGLAIALFLFAVMLGILELAPGIATLLGAGALAFVVVAGVLYVSGK